MDQLIQQYINFDHEEVDKHEENFIEDFDKHIKVHVWFWNYLKLSLVAPKFHIVKDHLVDFFLLWHAIGPYNEEFTESDHVWGNAEMLRMYGGLRDIQSQREESISKRQAVMNHPRVQLVIKKISPTKGKWKRMPDDRRERALRKDSMICWKRCCIWKPKWPILRNFRLAIIGTLQRMKGNNFDVKYNLCRTYIPWL